jgi:pimeloyl-ACP methyl ester carboxylesterase/DNA-binding CsgD family transcriptional regulator
LDAPPVQYVTTSDGCNIAYTVSGLGQPFVYVPNLATHALLSWERPNLGDWWRALARRFALVTYDSRGSGMSTRGLRDDHSFDDYQLDLQAVLERLQLGRFVLCGQGTGALISARYAEQHPERVAALVLIGGSVSIHRQRAGELLFRSLPEQDWEMFLHTSTSANIASSEDVARVVEITRQSVTQEEWLISRRRYKDDSAAVFSRLQSPTLVLHPHDFVGLPLEASIEVAQLSRGRLVVIDGAAALGDETQGIRAIESFLEELPQAFTGPLPARAPDGLSAREVEVLRLIANGSSNAQIAATLVISPHTVARHVSNILDKIGAANRAEATAYAVKNRLD